MNQNYLVPVEYVFAGTFTIRADSPGQAAEFAAAHCGMTANRGVHSTLPEGDVDWDFPHHPKKIVGEPEEQL